MITVTPLTSHLSSWQKDFAEAITDPAELANMLGLTADWVKEARAASAIFPLRVPRSYIARMRSGDMNDPLLRQVLPVGAELAEIAGYSADPLNESAALVAPRLLQKYRNRALLVTTGACAVHCRYCFRRTFDYESAQSDLGRWQEAIAALAADSEISELILSGGDPLSLSNTRLKSLTNSLKTVPHLKMLRIHTRQPIVLPSRVDSGLIAWLDSLPWRVTVVLHVNHPQELQGDVLKAIEELRQSGALLLNQSVLLAGINDNPTVLAELARLLHQLGVLPYYLHLLDPVKGTSHFAVSASRGIEIIDALARDLPGFLVPRLAQEIPGEDAKLVVAAGLNRLPI
ncbi:MAG: EF-P beta-lysylation protein EpmB [Gammaproteobacteria bacterium]|nr:EF-P beta-lysylation protein EpmB [Gammaproteobacteria bacterium]